jgi:hypothetical protein
MRIRPVTTALVTICLTAWAAPDAGVSAQGQAARRTTEPPAADVSAALLAEMRGLRADIAAASQASLRAQLLVARLQLQEQRIIHLDRRRAELTKALAEASQRSNELTATVNQMQDALRTDGGAPIGLPPAELEKLQREFSYQLKMLKGQLQDASSAEQRLRDEETEIGAALGTEQARWTDFNSRLDELERAMPRR